MAVAHVVLSVLLAAIFAPLGVAKILLLAARRDRLMRVTRSITRVPGSITRNRPHGPGPGYVRPQWTVARRG